MEKVMEIVKEDSWYHRNKEKASEQAKARYQKNKDHIKARAKKWKEENPERVKELRKSFVKSIEINLMNNQEHGEKLILKKQKLGEII
jgi:hypothetical protein